jgi:Flp pilus assembly protein TadD
MLERDFATAEKWLADFPSDEFPDIGPKSFYQAQTALARGDGERASTLFEQVRPALERNVRDHPDNAGDHAALGILYAYMGRKEEAIRESRRAVELCPEITDAVNGPQFAYNLALVYALTGEVDQAVPLGNDSAHRIKHGEERKTMEVRVEIFTVVVDFSHNGGLMEYDA